MILIMVKNTVAEDVCNPNYKSEIVYDSFHNLFTK